MKPDDENEESASPEELREATALAVALESGAAPPDAGGASAAADVSDALEAAALLRNARAPLTVPAGHEAIVAAHVAPALDARRARGRRRARAWIAAAIVAPAAAAVWLLFSTAVYERSAALRPSPPPAPTADLLAAQAQATRGGSKTTGALAALDLEMRAYRRRYHEGLRRRSGEEP